jgi:hypothetical protein
VRERELMSTALVEKTEGCTVTLGKMNWELLRRQKRVLLNLDTGSVVTGKQNEAIEGIVSLIDHIQDQVVDSGQMTSKTVFGKNL